jgi:hypothetical protein
MAHPHDVPLATHERAIAQHISWTSNYSFIFNVGEFRYLTFGILLFVFRLLIHTYGPVFLRYIHNHSFS